MANPSGKLFQFFYKKLGLHKTVDSASKAIANIKTTAVVQFTNAIENSRLLQELKHVPLEPQSKLPRKIVKWWHWYQHLVGLHAVEKARHNVLLTQNKLTSCREARHVLRQEAFAHNNKIVELYEELLRTKRDDPRYVTLTILENKILQEQSKNATQLNLLEDEERDHFLQLTTAINEYQDAQALNTQKYKYISIIASVLAALISFITSMVYNNQRMATIQETMEKLRVNNETVIIKRCNTLEKHLDTKLSNIESSLTGVNSYLSWIWNKIRYINGAAPAETKTESSGWFNTFKTYFLGYGIYYYIKGFF